ncbi:hypothetical protein C8R47DRAFT_1206695 [Mycena vitilis]|nr:hypothetical protein C8R47DRAFT_1206695 [Mycena vitilis]
MPLAVWRSFSSAEEGFYSRGRKLEIYFKPELSPLAHDPFTLKQMEINSELSPDWQAGFVPLTVSILKLFTPSTCAVVLLVESLDPPESLAIPKQIILKLNDRRFGYRDEFHPKRVWKRKGESRLRKQIRQLLEADRSTKLYDWPGYSPASDGAWTGWELEVCVWAAKQCGNLREALAYRHLRALQGDCIPRFYGTVRLPLSPDTPFLHPVVDFVSGLAIEHISGPNMGDVKVGVDLTKDVAEITSQRVIDTVAKIRNTHCLHNDLRLPNIVLRNYPRDPMPVIIDFGNASVMEPDQPKEDWPGGVNEANEIRRVLTWPDHGGWHVASPLQPHVYERIAGNIGYATLNERIENLPESIRAIQFERVPGAHSGDAKERMMLWRPRPGVRTQDDYVHEQMLLSDPDGTQE